MVIRRTLLAMTLAWMMVACGDDGNGSPSAEEVRDDTERVAEDVRDAAGDAAATARERLSDGWASLRTDAERLVDRVKTRGDSDAKQELLDRCRDRLEDARQAESDAAGRIESACDRIRDTDVDADDTWDEIRKELDDIDVSPNS